MRPVRRNRESERDRNGAHAPGRPTGLLEGTSYQIIGKHHRKESPEGITGIFLSTTERTAIHGSPEPQSVLPICTLSVGSDGNTRSTTVAIARRIVWVDVEGFWSGGNWIAPEADLFDADLRGHCLYGAELFGAYLSGADLTSASLPMVDLTGAYLSKANLPTANLAYACFVAADLTEADLSFSNLCAAQLDGACLTGASLRWANLAYASLRGANLRGASLRWANLSCADLTGADLVGADLTGANFAGASLTDANLTEVVEEDTIWPDELAGENAVADARWALREAWTQVEQKEAEDEPEDRAA